MMARRGLGKGLDSMIPDKNIVVKDNSKLEQKEDVSRETLIDINKIEPNHDQPRKLFDEDSLLDLADSIKQFGIIQPLIVQKKDKLFEIIAGERRWRAAKLAGIKQIPVIVKEFSPQEVMEIALIENIQREDLNAIEEALAYQKLISEFNLKQDELAERVSKSRAAITNTIRLLKLDKRVQQMLIDDMLTSGHARTLVPIEDKELQYSIASKVFDEKLSVRDTEKLVKKVLEEGSLNSSTKKELKSTFTEQETIVFKQLEEKMKQIIGSKVLIKRKNKDKGKIEIDYYSNDELERIIDLINNAASV